MSATADVMAIVLFVFFAVGVAVGIVIVIALSARRADKAGRWSRPPATTGDRSGYFGHDEQDDDDESPWWQARGDN